MAETILFNIFTEVLKNLGSAALSEVASAWGYKSQLEKLENTINTLKDVLLDAEERQAGSHAIRGWLERLTTVVYAADDLFDEFATFVARKQHSGGNRVTKEVSTFFSSSNQIALAFKFSQNIEKITQELDDIVEDCKRFSFLIRDEGRVVNTGMKRDETYSFVDADEVIGRDGDKKAVLDLLLPFSTIDEHDEDLPVIPIVGMGGMGKTTLAQLLYNDPKVCDSFELKLWVCISDDDFDIKVIVKKLLESATGKKTEDLVMDQLQGKLQKEISDKKYLLVLDDVWNEDREKWLKLRELLKIGRKGSKILMTTRSKGVAEIMGTSPPRELQGLSEDKSWDLFEKMAFKHGQAEQNPQLVKVGKEIVKKCGYVPLAIRTIGSLLYGKDESKWFSIKNKSLANITDKQNDIMKILKISYDHLWSPLKSCFAYCALFPKDHLFKKEELIELWIAEGFIADSEGQSLEDVGEEYFLVLLHSGFFQDVERNEWGDIMECKMHDLMHDLAQEVAGLKCRAAKFRESNFDEKIVHLSFANPLSSSEEIPINNMLNLKLLRTFLLLGNYPSSILISQQILTRFSNLRVLDLKRLRLKSLSSSIGKLIHLRYLDISENDDIKKLPNSITNLWNLQTLILSHCWNLKTLPKNMRKLTNLRSLDVGNCDKLRHMPSGIGGLTLLSKLPLFVVGRDFSFYSWILCPLMILNLRGKFTNTAKLSDLKNMNNLRGELEIEINRNEKNMLEAAEAELSSKPGLTDLTISFKRYSIDEDCEHDEAVLEGLKPHSNIRSLDIRNYSGQKLPSWARMDNLCITLPNLVHISLYGFESCKELPTMSQLCNLKQLKISLMFSVEYMEGNNSSSSLFFPSLQVLDLWDIPNLKGWWKEGEAIMESHNNNELQEDASNEIMGGQRQLMQFSKLSTLSIKECRNLRMLPLCPNVEDLTLTDTNESLSVLNMVTNTTMMISNSSSSGSGLNLKRLVIDNAENLMSLPIHSLQHLSYLKIDGDTKLESSERLGEVFATLSSSLKTLEFNSCDKLRSISKGLEHLTALENLNLFGCGELDIKGNEEEDGGNGIGKGMPWIALNTSLRSLELRCLDKLVGLPSGLQHLSNLRSLTLKFNNELKEVPEWISCLTSLTYLELTRSPELKSLPEGIRNLTTLNQLKIIRCERLTERCLSPNGIDWPKIQHIPFVDVRDWDELDKILQIF